MRYTLTLSLITVIHLTGFGQQTDVPVIQFQNTLIQTNPATIGLKYKRAINAVYHQDHLYSDYNASANINYAMRLDSTNGGVGISYMYDNWYTAERTQVILAHYARHFRLGTSSVLSLGVSGGVRFHKYDYYWIASQTPNDPLLPSNQNQARFQCNVGVAFLRKNLSAGFSITQINSPKYRIGYSSSITVKPDYWFFADYTFKLPANFELKPQVQFVVSDIETQPYMSLVATYNKRVWVGANYTYDLYIGGMVGIDIREKFRFGVGYSMYKYKLYNGKVGRMYEVVLAYLLK